MKSKKTFNIQSFKAYVNQQLMRKDHQATDQFKEGLCVILEHVLMVANVYHGFNDNYWRAEGYDAWKAAGEPDFPEKNAFLYGPSGQRYNRHYY